jgi:deoxyguanosine kinase
MMNHKIISVEGNIGSGKSTLLSLLEEKYKDNKQIVFLQEPIEDWNTIKGADGKTILQKFYEDIEKYSFTFQFTVLLSFIKVMDDTIKKHPNAIIITERSLYTNKHVFAKMLFDDKKINEIDYQVYLKWFDYFARLDAENSINKMIYVNTKSTKCLERINKRGRKGEETISIEYLDACDTSHNVMLFNEKVCNDVLVIDGNPDIETDEQRDAIFKIINDFIYA